MYACCAGHIDIPDMGDIKPKYFRFRKPFLTFNVKESTILELKSSDNAKISIRPYGEIEIEAEGEIFFLPIKTKEISWHRLNYTWYGFEFGAEIDEILKHIKVISNYLTVKYSMKKNNIPGWLYVERNNQGRPRYAIDLNEFHRILQNKQSFSDCVCIGLCMYDSYAYHGDNWGNGWKRVSEQKMIETITKSYSEHETLALNAEVSKVQIERLCR